MRRFLTVSIVGILALLSAGPASPKPRTASNEAHVSAATRKDEIVTFNTKTHKYHCRSCRYATACTSNCVDIKQSDAVQRGGVACKICGGTCTKSDGGESQPIRHIKCCDGTLSPSCTYVHSGCCSHHGGVCE